MNSAESSGGFELPGWSPARHLELVAAEVATVAADVIRGSLGAAAPARTKTSPTDVVTHTDLRSEKVIRAELLQRCPGSAIVGEELDDVAGVSGVEWIVDPIDGTVNFLYDLPVVSVSIAATTGGKVVAGAVADVVRGEIFTATLGEGARRDGTPITTAKPSDLAQSLIGTGFSYDSELRSLQVEILRGLLPASRDVRCMGSAALHMCWVGCGRLDGYYEQHTQIYDYAAGGLIAAEAGATVELPGSNRIGLAIGAAPTIFDDLRSIVRATAGG